MASDTPDPYAHGHHESVLRSHGWRTADNSAAHLLPHLRPGDRLLDVGCGPGTITVDLARRINPGAAVGIDAVEGVLTEARSLLAKHGAPTNCSFSAGDVYALEFDDSAFDVVYAHQVLQHLTDPSAALTEMRRVLRPGGILAVRDADYGAMAWAPSDPALDEWLRLYVEIAHALDAEPSAGRFLLGWVQRAGFDEVVATSSTWTFSTPESRQWWGGLWADRVRHSSFADHARRLGHTDGELDDIAAAWLRWADRPDGWFMCPHGEIIARA